MSNTRDVTDYYLFYATNELLGLKKMKEAMWKVDETGEFRFSDATDPNQLVLFEKAPNYRLLTDQILERFKGRQTTVEAVENFVVIKTAFRESHYKKILKFLEMDKKQIAVPNPPTGRKRGTFGDPKMAIRFQE